MIELHGYGYDWEGEIFPCAWLMGKAHSAMNWRVDCNDCTGKKPAKRGAIITRGLPEHWCGDACDDTRVRKSLRELAATPLRVGGRTSWKGVDRIMRAELSTRRQGQSQGFLTDVA